MMVFSRLQIALVHTFLKYSIKKLQKFKLLDIEGYIMEYKEVETGVLNEKIINQLRDAT